MLGTPPKVQKTDPDAYELFLQAEQLGREFPYSKSEELIALYKRTLEIDPNYAPALFGLAANYSAQASSSERNRDEGIALAREMYKKALAIDPDYARAHAGLGMVAVVHDQDLAAAAQHLERALALDPTDLWVLGFAFNLTNALGRNDTTLELAEYMVRRDPLDPWSQASLSYSYLIAGRLDEAIASARAALKLSPELLGGHSLIGEALLLKGDYAGALNEFAKEQDEAFRLSGLAMAHHSLGQTTQSNSALMEMVKKNEKIWPAGIACVYAYRRENDRAFEWMGKAVAYRDAIVNNCPTDLYLRNLHDDPRWLPFLRKIGKAPEQLAAIKFDLKVPQ